MSVVDGRVKYYGWSMRINLSVCVMMLFIMSIQLKCVAIWVAEARFNCPRCWSTLCVRRLSGEGGQRRLHGKALVNKTGGFTSTLWNGFICERWGGGWWFTGNAPRTLPSQSASTPLSLSANALLWQRSVCNTLFSSKITPIIRILQPTHSSWVFISALVLVSWGNAED